ncbi:MAG: HIRAN domain-containing protein [Clostridia bacterium]
MLSPSRAAGAGAALFLLVSATAPAGEPVPAVRLLVQSSPLAGFRYHAAREVWNELRVGDALELAREPENPYDARAVSVSWRGRKLGYVPRRENTAVAWALDRGERLGARVSVLAKHPNPARRIRFEVFLE